MNNSDITRDYYMLKGPLAKKGYDWWWHSFTAINEETKEERPFYIEYFTCNPKHAKDEPVIVWNNEELRKQGVRPSYLMVNVGFWGKEKAQLHRFFSLKDVSIEYDKPLHLIADDCECSEKHMKGSVNISEEDVKNHPEWMCDAGSMSWDIEIDKQITYNVGYGAGKFFRALNAFQMFWHAEGMKSKYKGWIILNGKKYIVQPDTCYGYADKNWGKDFTSPWVWLSSNNLYSKKYNKKLENSVFDIGGGRPKVFFIALNRKLLGTFFYEGVNYEFNFSKFWTGSKTVFSSEQNETEIIWHVTQSTRKAKMEVEIRCKKEEMLFINYEAPNGLKRYNQLYNGGNGYGVIKLYTKENGEYQLLDEIEAKNIGCEYGEYDPLVK